MFTKLVRIGRDAELKTTQGGTVVCSFSAAYDVGWGQNKKTQWLRCSLFGNRAEKSAQHFTKGKQIVIYADSLQVEEWQKQDGTTGHALTCILQSWDFVSGQQQPQQSQPQQSMSQQPQGGFQQPQQAPVQQPQGFDDPIPF